MPIYEYSCKKCGTKTEILSLSHKKINPPSCYLCKKTMHKVIGNTTFILKGGGWYQDGYSTKKEKSNE